MYKLIKRNKERINRKLKKKLKKSEPHYNWKVFKLIRIKGIGKYNIAAVKRNKKRISKKVIFTEAVIYHEKKVVAAIQSNIREKYNQR
jgi:hypothetical protein